MWHACWRQDAVWVPVSDPAMHSGSAYPSEGIMSRLKFHWIRISIMAEPMPASPEEAYKWSVTIEADTVALERQRKEGQSRGFTVYCDDSDLIGGDNSAPPPLSYFTIGLGVSLLTEISRYGRLMQVNVHKARVHISAHFRAEGSVS